MKVEQHFFNQSGIIRNEQLRPTRVISKDFSFTKNIKYSSDAFIRWGKTKIRDPKCHQRTDRIFSIG